MATMLERSSGSQQVAIEGARTTIVALWRSCGVPEIDIQRHLNGNGESQHPQGLLDPTRTTMQQTALVNTAAHVLIKKALK
jgi:hypothetical protein